jgi:putative redox protein
MMKFAKLFFHGAAGDKLAARLDFPPAGKPINYAIFAHCFTCTKNIKAAGNISHALTGAGIAVFRFDFTGLGESEGDFADTNFSSNVEDLIAAGEFLKSHYSAPSILIGHSLGGAAVLQAASDIPSAVAVVTIGAPSDPGHLARYLEKAREKIEREGEAEVLLTGRKFKIKKQFIKDLKQSSMHTAISELNRALLIFHSPIDNIVSVDNAAKIFQAARHPKSYISLDTADHLLTDQRDSLYVGSMIATWVQRYLGITQSPVSLQPGWGNLNT